MKKDLENLKRAVRIFKKIRAGKAVRRESSGRGLSLKVSSGGGTSTRGKTSAQSSAAERTGRERIAKARGLVRNAKMIYNHRGGFYKTGAAIVNLVRSRMS